MAVPHNELQADWDYIIAGAGSAGSVLANRLSADPANNVLLLEGGGRDNWIWFHIPVGYLFAMGNPRADWLYVTEAQNGLNGRKLPYPRGRVLGGCSAINGMLYLRGQSADYDHWRQIGLPGWSWSDVLPLFREVEDHADGADDFHGAGGEWRVEHPRIRWDLLDRIADAAEQAGIPRVDDFNTGDNFGISYFQVNQKRGRRWSASRGFLDPVRHRANLKIETGALVDRVVVEAGKAVGIAYRKDGREIVARASGEVILAAGAVASPAILERSGIGNGEILRVQGIETVAHLPGVGENLQDHLQIRPIYRVEGIRTLNTDYHNLFRRAMMGVNYALFRRGPMTAAPSQMGAFAYSAPHYDTPNVEFHFQPMSLDSWDSGLHPFAAFTASICNLRPTSRGSVHLKSADPLDAPSISPNYLSTDDDRRVAVESLKLARRIVAQPALAPYKPEEYKPGAHIHADEDLVVAAGDIATTIFHPVATAKMGPADDAMAVLDERLRVRGISGLRVIDASAMPEITSGNTNSPTIMIATKGARMVLEDARR